MKKILLIIAAAFATLLSSCDMELYPHSAIDDETGMQTIEDARNYRVSLYSPLKSLVVGSRLYIEDLRADSFHAMQDFGNYFGLFYAWILQSTDQDVESVWYGDYGCIASANYAINRFPRIIESGVSEAAAEELELYIAEAHMTRALAYLDLVTKYCEAYDPDRADQQLGLPLTTEYNPTSDASTYPGRSSLAETYELILSDLDAAAAITTVGAANSNYYTEDVVEALRARVCLYMQDWEGAYDSAFALTNSNKYALATADAHASLWLNDISTENIMLIFASVQDLCSAMGGGYYINDKVSGNGNTPDPEYIPTQTLIDLYEDDDVRKRDYFETREVTVVGTGTTNLEIFWKFPSNPSLQSGSLNYVNMGKPFRIAEQYLIAAEAAAQLGDVAGGVALLNAVREARGASTQTITTAEQLLSEVKLERRKELVGEGFRMFDLKRWGDNVVRGEAQDDAFVRSGADYAELYKSAGSNGYLWPIPKAEIDANPQMKGQQNPGY